MRIEDGDESWEYSIIQGSGQAKIREGIRHGRKKDHPSTIDCYISQFPEDVQQILVKIRAVIKKYAPEAVERKGYHKCDQGLHSSEDAF